ncbi:monovalent cation:proton antiporter-2 (CPA2) family protein [Halomonas cupida]|uniref:monovalent cation:proton antiporter-2 (CPA2) family protein n=1 Tax=Halomonas cupida TaxID=44933 RepID=UPI003A8DCB7F
MASSLLFLAFVFLVAAVLIVPILKRLGLGEVLGYLVAGVAIGPAALGLVPDAEAVLHFAEVGIIFLLFIIGLELKPSRLRLMRKAVFGGGGLQMSVTTVVLAAGAWWFGLALIPALIVGFSLALCSTPLVLHMLGERHELNARHGRLAFATLLFQDIATLPVLAAIPILASGSLLEAGWGPLITRILIAAPAVVALVVGGRFLLGPMFQRAAATGSREVFAGASLAVVIGSALLMDMAGLSMALGAFAAGILLSDSEYRHSIEADIEPFRGLLLGLFFMAVGMTAKIELLVEAPGLVLGLTGALLVTKAFCVMMAARLFRASWSDSLNLAMLLPQGGEFAFVLLTAAGGSFLLDSATVELLILVVSLSMAATPVLYLLHVRLIRPLLQPAASKPEFDMPRDESPRIIIAGFGRFGQIVGRILQGLKIPYTVLDIDARHVQVVRRYGNEVYYGDAARIDLLEAAGASKAQMLVVAVSDVESSMRIIERAQKRFPHLKIHARARNRYHALLLMRANVSYLQRELLPGSLDMTRETLIGLGIPRDEAQHAVDIFRRHDERTLQRQLEVFGNERKLIQNVQQAASELEQLYEADEDIVMKPDSSEAGAQEAPRHQPGNRD